MESVSSNSSASADKIRVARRPSAFPQSKRLANPGLSIGADLVSGARPPLGGRSGLRTYPPALVLDREDVAVEGSGPLLTLHGHLEIPQGVADIALNPAP